MSYYFTVAAARAIDVIFAYRGDDTKNSLLDDIPSDEEAHGSLHLPASMSKSAVEHFLVQTFVNLATANPGNHFLIRLSDRNAITYWMVPLKE